MTAHRDVQRRLVLSIRPVVASDGSTQLFLFGDEAWQTRPTDTPANAPVRGLLTNAGSLRREIFRDRGVAGAVAPSYGAVVLSNKGGELDPWVDYGVAGAEVWLHWGEVDAPYPSGYVPVWRAYCGSWRADSDAVTINLRDQLQLLQAPVVTEGFDGTGGAEGRGSVPRRKQFVAGDPGFFEPVLVDPVRQIYFAGSTGTGGLHDFWKLQPTVEVNPYDVYIGGVKVQRANVDYASRAELESVQPAEGQVRWYFGSDSVLWPGAKNGGCWFRLVGSITGPVRVYGVGYPTDADHARIGAVLGSFFAAHFALRAGVALADIDLAKNELAVLNTLVNDDRTYLDVLNDQALGRQGWFGFDRLGRFRSGYLLDPASTSPYYGCSPGLVFPEPAADSASIFEFDLGAEVDLTREPPGGMAVPARAVSGTAGECWPCEVANGATTLMRDYLTRQVWSSFSGQAAGTALRDPGSLPAGVAIRARLMQSEYGQRLWMERYLALYGGQRHFWSFRLQMTAQLLQLDLHDCVTLKHPRFGLAAGVKCRIVAITIDCTGRVPVMVFSLWSGTPGRYTGGSTSTLPGGSGDGGVVVPPAVERDRAATVGGLGYGRMSMVGRGGVASIGMVGGSGQAAESAGGGAVDPHASIVLLRMHFDGSNGSTNFVDSSSYARAFTAYGDAQISTTGALFGQCGYFEGTSIDYASTTDLSGFGLLVGASYTIELAFSRPGFPSGDSATEILLLVTGPGQPQLVQIGVTDFGTLSVVVEGVALFEEAITVGAWRRIAVTYDHVSDLARLYVDGTRVATAGGSGGISTTAHLLLVGGHWTGFGGSVDTRMDELRITPVARYTGASYTLDPAPFPDS